MFYIVDIAIYQDGLLGCIQWFITENNWFTL